MDHVADQSDRRIESRVIVNGHPHPAARKPSIQISQPFTGTVDSYNTGWSGKKPDRVEAFKSCIL